MAPILGVFCAANFGLGTLGNLILVTVTIAATAAAAIVNMAKFPYLVMRTSFSMRSMRDCAIVFSFRRGLRSTP